MTRFALRSARAGLDLFEKERPHEELAFFLALGLLTNTRGIFFALLNRDAKRSSEHHAAIHAWKNSPPPEFKRFFRLIVRTRNLFTKEFATTPIVVRVTSNYAPPEYEVPIYIPYTADLDEILTDGEKRWRSILRTDGHEPQMRVDLLPECASAIALWETTLPKIEDQIRSRRAD